MKAALARFEPAHLLMLVVGVAALVIGSGPLTEVDSLWHVLIGREIVSSHSVHHLGTTWTTYRGGDNWVTSQWLAEVIMAKAVDWFGWVGLVWFRGVLGVVVLFLLARMLLRRATPRTAALVFTAVAIPVAGTIQERPLLLSLLFMPWLAGLACDLALKRTLPRWWLVFGLVVLWANLHGMWVLAPLAFVVAAVALLAERSSETNRLALRSAGLACLAVVAGWLTPIGLTSLTLPFTFSAAARNIIEEWEVTRLWDPYVATTLVLIGLLVWAWARTEQRVPRAEIVYSAAWIIFMLPAVRNVAPAAIMLAPVVALRLGTTWAWQRAVTTHRERLTLQAVAVVLVLLGAVWWVGTSTRGDVLREAKPIGLARLLAAEPGDKRVLNSYNAGGILAAQSGPDVSVAIDGRADRYGRAYIDDYLARIRGSADWQPFVKANDLNYAVLESNAPLIKGLKTAGWTELAQAQGYVLLKAPTASTPPS